MQDTIKEPALRELIDAGAIDRACLAGQLGGYIMTVRLGQHERTLVTARGAPRLFTLDNASKYLCAIGLRRFEVDASGFVPGRMRKPRPDRAEALKKTKSVPKQGVLI
ncbi:hypothetical protein THI4931_17900 [Pandoraea sputorum]|nr:hypothetical protein THI4931_17900 [Pandoraea sputorum]